MNELSAQRQSGACWKTSTKLLHWNGLRPEVRRRAPASFVISAVSVMKTTGARNAIASRDQEAVVGDRDQEAAPAHGRRRLRRTTGAVTAAASLTATAPW